MTTLYEKKKIIVVPTVFKAPEIKEGDEIAIHSVLPEHLFVQIAFKQTVNKKNESIYKGIINYEVIYFNKNLELKKTFKNIKDNILALGDPYYNYNYLFVVQNGEIRLLSVGINGIALGAMLTETVARKLNIDFKKPCWVGTYVYPALAVFYESNIFVQPK